MLELSNVKKSYGDVEILKGINLKVESGDIVGFIGKNGAGKTTTIKIIVGLLKKDEGNIFINGMNPNNENYKKSFGYVPDEPFIYEGLTGEEYLMFLSELWDIPFSYEKVKPLIKKFQLEKAYKMFISKYSFGMKKKIAIIGALIHNPKVLILDEPLNGLDPESSYITKEILKVYASKGNSVFFSSHTLEVVEKLCTKIAILKDGIISDFKAIDDILSTNGKSLESYFYEVSNSDE